MRQSSGIEFDEALFAGDAERALERPAPPAAFLITGGLALALVALVIWRIAALGTVSGEAYRARAAGNAHRELTLAARRGTILDRNGEVLAENAASFSVFGDANLLVRDAAARGDAFGALRELLGADPDELERMLRESDLEASGSVSLVRNISPSEAIELRALAPDGIAVLDDYERAYPMGEVFAHVLGYTGAGERGGEIVGKAGVEAAHDAALRGEDGYALGYRDARGEVFEERVVREPQPGRELALTVDAALTRALHDRLASGLRQVGSRAGVGIALDPRTGEVLALASLPSFDPNAFVARSRSAERQAILSDPRQPLFNRAIAGAYPPGSTIKPFHALAALREGVMRSEETIYSSGVLEIRNPYRPDEPSRFPDWRAHGAVDARSALARSSNVYFYVAGGGVPRGEEAPAHAGLGIERLRRYWELFRLGEPTGIDLGGEATGSLPSPEAKETRTGEPWRLGDTYNVSIGQGDLTLTPLQLAALFASIGSGGRLYRPHLALGEPPELLLDYSAQFASELAEVRAGLRDAVAAPYGTAWLLHDLPMEVAGKTGSAQVEQNRKVNAFFAGYAPAEDPEIVLLVLVEDAREGSLNALPIARDVLAWYYENRM